MKTLQGKLEFISLWHPIKLETDKESINLQDYLFPIFEKINGKKAKMNYNNRSIFISADETSENILSFEYNKLEDTISFLLNRPDGFTNLNAYLSNVLRHINGQFINVALNEDNVLIESDKNQTVYGLYYTKNNSCKIPDEDVKNICNPGTTHCCIFLTASDEFYCEKFNSPISRNRLNKYNDGLTNATRIGNCELLGRKEIFKNKLNDH
jgi:hypothetical protein